MKNNDLKISDEELKSVLGKFRLGSKNHYISDCPICGKTNHFYINRTTQQWDCKKCGEAGNIVTLLISVNKLFLLGEYKSIDRNKINLLSEYIRESEEDLSEIAEVRKKPIGFKRIYNDRYLSSRKLTNQNFEKFDIGYTDLKSSLKDYVIFLIKEDNDIKGYVARINWTKEELKEFELKTGIKKARYRNDKGAKFSNLLFGYDEITENTKTLILVEGLIDKITLDNILFLDNQEEIKCCATFGKKISPSQILKLLKKRLEKIILIFDDDAIKEMKKYGSILSGFFDVELTFTIGKDINESSKDDVLEIFSRLKPVEDFNRKAVKNKL